MQSVTDPTQGNNTQRPPVSAPLSDSAATAASDFQSFLTLLTAQLRNQDPLSPLDSTQFVEQLASFSAVEQQIQTNSKLDALADRLSINAIEQASQWIGKDVETLSSAAHFEGDPLSYIIPAGEVGATSEIIVSDLSGNVVFSELGDSQKRDFVWSGAANDGGVAPAGDYIVTINRYDSGELVDVAEPIAITRVVQARFEENGGVKLVLENGAVVDPSGISALRSVEDANAQQG